MSLMVAVFIGLWQCWPCAGGAITVGTSLAVDLVYYYCIRSAQ